MVPLMIVRADPEDEALLDRICVHLGRGGLLAYPTETVYGFGAAVDPVGVRGVVELKGKAEGKPMLVLLPGSAVPPGRRNTGERDATGLSWTPGARRLAEAFWPGPLTLILQDEGQRFPSGVRNEDGGVAVRVSPHPFVAALMGRWGRPLLSTSANRPGRPAARTAREVSRAVEGRPGLHRLWIADGGPLLPSDPSTLVDCSGDRPVLLRAGPITKQTLLEVVPELDDRHPT